MGDGDHARLRALPSVDALAAGLDGPRPLAVAAARTAVEQRRSELRAGALDELSDEQLVARAAVALARARRPSLRRVVNATGVILHTNLGRAPLAPGARAAVARAAEGYSNLEWDAATGERGSRQEHVAELLAGLCGAEAALAVNNGAGAALLAVAALAGPGRSVVVSRGQLVEIGGSFRVPEVIAASGTRLVEVGTTNRTRLADYAAALDDEVGAVLRVHPSNFRQLGFVEEVPVERLCELGVAVIDDVGSGLLAEGLGELGGGAGFADEPPVRRSVAAGATLTCFSGDKLLGGPQAGLLVGGADAVARAARHPLARALRIDKLSLAALEATLRLYQEPERALAELPTLAMARASELELAERAGRLAALVTAAGMQAEVVRSTARVGGGTLPLLELPGPVVAVAAPGLEAGALAARLRAGEPAVAGRVQDGCLLLDPRTLDPEELELVGRACSAALAS